MYQYSIDLPNLESIATGHYSFYTTTSLTLSSRIKVYHFHELIFLISNHSKQKKDHLQELKVLLYQVD